MKRGLKLDLFLVVLISLWCVANVSATDYYVNASKSCAGDGTSEANAWCSVANVSDASFNPGDNIYFARGETWREQLTVPDSGSSGNPITFGAYGSGDDPIISGADIITTWTGATSWTTGDSYTFDTSSNGSQTSRQHRLVYSASISGTKVRITYCAAAPAAANVDGSSVGPRSSTTEDYSAGPTRITWDTGSNTTTVGAGADKVSDEITFTTTNGNDYLFHIYFADDFAYRYVASGGTQYYKDDQPDETLTEDVTYFSGSAVRGISLIEIFGPITNIWQVAATTEVKTLLIDGTFGDKKTSVGALVNEFDWYWSENVLYLYATADPDGEYTTIEGGQRNNGILTNAKDYITIQNLTIEAANAYNINSNGASNNLIVSDCTIRYSGSDGISFWTNTGGGNDLIDSNTVYENQKSGISARAAGHVCTSGNETIISNNTVYDNGEYGIYVLANYWIVESNVVHDNGQITGQSQGITLMSDQDNGDGQHNIIRYNIVYNQNNQGINADGAGIVADRQNDNNKIYGNIVYNNSGNGISIYEAKNITIYNNIVYGNNQESNITRKGEIKIYSYPEWQESDNITVKNNIVYSTVSNGYAIYVGSNEVSNVLDISYNLLYAQGANFYYWDNAPGNSLTTWNGLVGVGTDLNSDPLFTDASSGGDFTLQATSPAIDAGVDLGASYDDGLDSDSVWPNSVLTLDQDDYGAGWEIGAYVYVDAVNPVITFSCSPTSVTAGETITCSCSATDDVDSSPTVSYTTNPSTSNTGTFTTTCTVTDSSGNSVSSNISYYVTSTGSGTPTTTWTTHSITEDLFEQGYTRELGVRNRIRVQIEGEDHFIGVVSISESQATIEISSNPVQVILDAGEDAKVDVTDDGFYDIYVLLNGITNNKANVTIQKIHEEVPEGGTGVETTGELLEEEKSLIWLWLVLGLVVVIVVILTIYFIKKQREMKEINSSKVYNA